VTPERVVVVGAGITGLAAAYRLREISLERGLTIDLSVLERASRIGGCIETQCDGEFVLELGPDSIVTEKASGLGLVRRLGLERDTIPIRAEFRGARVVRGQRLVPIPSDFRFFTPTSLVSLVSSGLFSWTGVARAALEPFVPARTGGGDESLASFVTRRFGREVLDRLAQPLIGGIYSGDPSRLSMRATIPQFLDLERRYGSLIRGMRATRNTSRIETTPRLISLRNGLGEIVDSLARALESEIRTRHEAVELRYNPVSNDASRWAVRLADGTTIEADAIICALPAYQAAHLIAPVRPRLGEILCRIVYHSVATVTMAFASADLPELPRCTGFVVPYTERRKILAATLVTQKYEHRAPAGYTLVRTFLGGALQPDLATKSDEELGELSRSELRALLGISAVPRFAIVRRWHRSMPEYALGHAALVDEVEREVAGLNGFALAGSAYRGAGIPDCIRMGERAAESTVAGLQRARAPLS
jgi:protoporphyrinogen/coproporphyrinogen III oxidase